MKSESKWQYLDGAIGRGGDHFPSDESAAPNSAPMSRPKTVTITIIHQSESKLRLTIEKRIKPCNAGQSRVVIYLVFKKKSESV